MVKMPSFSLVVPVVWTLLACPSWSQLIESERLQEYRARNYTWPPNADEYTPNTDGWRKIFQRRFRQLDALSSEQNSYNGYIGAVHAGLLCPNFTEFGWALTRAPQQLVDELKSALLAGLAQDDIPIEMQMLDSIETPNRPYFIRTTGLNTRALRMIQPIVEAWSGVPVRGSMAYGLRVYRNQSALNMHLDRSDTHILSAILHVGHDEDSEPWPLAIEDFSGNTNEVVLQEGQVLLYESSKCVHGRPKQFNGTWYSSLFIHYYPVEWDSGRYRMEGHYRVPSHWGQSIPSDEEKLLVIDTTLKEPGCAHEWCAVQDSVSFSGSVEYGKVLSANGVLTKLENLPSEEELQEIASAFRPQPSPTHEDDEL